MTQVEPTAATRDAAYTGWDLVAVFLLGLTLLGAGWLDARSYLSPRSRPAAEFTLTEPRLCERVVADELYRFAREFRAAGELRGAGNRQRDALPRCPRPPPSTILFSMPHPRARLSVEFYNSIPDQDIIVRCNDTVVEQFLHQPPGPIERTYSQTLRPGTNSISFAFARYNHGPLDLKSTDSRPPVGHLVREDGPGPGVTWRHAFPP